MKKILLHFIEIWQIYFSKDYAYWKDKNVKRVCNLHLSCSEYTREKIEKYGVVKGIFLGYNRVKLCKKKGEKNKNILKK